MSISIKFYGMAVFKQIIKYLLASSIRFINMNVIVITSFILDPIEKKIIEERKKNATLFFVGVNL